MAANEQQMQAINSDHRTILVLAGAGAGKTYCLINRVKRLVEEGVNPRSILAITFTNAAAFEMSERFKRECPSPNQPEFRTFHGFSYSMLVREPAVRAKLNYTKVPDICEDKELKKIEAEVKLQLNIKLSEDKLSGKVPCVSMKEKHELELYHKGIVRKLKADNKITFDMLNSEVSNLFATDDESIQRFKKQYTHILCDEMQDTDDIQMKFLNSFPVTTNFFLVGDALQSIYQFRNCTNKYVKLLSANPDWEHIKLYKNYRSTRNICEYANRMSTYADASYRIEMEGQRDGDDVEVFYGACSDFNNIVDQKHMKKVIQYLETATEGQAILCRTNKEVQFICDMLKSKGIEYSTSNKTADDAFILNAVSDNEYMISWLSTFLDATRYADYIRGSAQLNEPDIRWFLNNYGGNAKVKPKATKIVEIRKVLTSALSIEEKFKEVNKLLKTKMKDVDLSDVHDSKELVEYIKNHLNELEEHKVYVGTIHSSKGLEYDCVHLMGVNDRSFPLDSEEMLNLYYVGITRARNHLRIYRG